MSTATAFKCPFVFGHEGCITEATKGARNFFPYDCTLAQAMAWHWNIESLRFQYSSDVTWLVPDGMGDFITYNEVISGVDETCDAHDFAGPKVYQPYERVCPDDYLLAARVLTGAVTRTASGPNIGGPFVTYENATFGCYVSAFAEGIRMRYDTGDSTYWAPWQLGVTKGGGVNCVMSTTSGSITEFSNQVTDFGVGKGKAYLYVGGGVSSYTVNSWSLTVTPAFFTY